MRVADILFVAFCLTSCLSKKSCHEEDVKGLLCDDSVMLQKDEDFDELLCDHVISEYVLAGQRVPNGTTCFAPVKSVHPTQSSIGGLMKQCKSHKIEDKYDSKGKLIDYINRKPGFLSSKDLLEVNLEDNHEKLQKYRLLRIYVINDFVGEESDSFERKLEQNGVQQQFPP